MILGPLSSPCCGEAANEQITSQINTELPNTTVLKEKSLLWDIKNKGSNLNEGNMEDSIRARFFIPLCLQALCHRTVAVPLTSHPSSLALAL